VSALAIAGKNTFLEDMIEIETTEIAFPAIANINSPSESPKQRV